MCLHSLFQPLVYSFNPQRYHFRYLRYSVSYITYEHGFMKIKIYISLNSEIPINTQFKNTSTENTKPIQ